jgi:hypothetical protein
MTKKRLEKYTALDYSNSNYFVLAIITGYNKTREQAGPERFLL